MTDPTHAPQDPARDEVEAPRYLLKKRNGGLYWMPDFCGYTGAWMFAGRYTLAEASERVSITTEMIPEDEGEEFTRECWPEVKVEALLLERDALLARATAAEAAVGDRDEAIALLNEEMAGNRVVIPDLIAENKMLAARATAAEAERDKRAHEADVLRRVLTVAERGGDGPDVELAQECAILTGALMRSDAEIAALTARATAAEAQAAAAREGALREAEALARDFDWVLPLYVDKAVNEATDDAAEEVARQIADAIAALAPTAPEGDVPTRGLLQVPHE